MVPGFMFLGVANSFDSNSQVIGNSNGKRKRNSDSASLSNSKQ